MFFYMYKFFANFFMPPGIFILISLGLIILIKINRKRLKKALIVLAATNAFLIYVLSIEPLPVFLAKNLEKRSVIPAPDVLGSIDSIIVPGGGVNGTVPSYTSTARLVKVLEIYQKLPHKEKVKIILTGGGVYRSSPNEADISAHFLKNLGIKSTNLVIENKSRTTFENALYCKKISSQLDLKKPLIVSSAIHLPRVLYSFRKTGLEVIPYPCDMISGERYYDFSSFLPSAFYLYQSRKVLWEYVGIIYYRVIYR